MSTVRCTLAACFALASALAMGDSRVPELTGRALASTADAHRGATLYRESCAGCHRADALGAEDQAIPALAGQHPSYLVKQMAAFIEFEREDAGVHRTLAAPALSSPQALSDLAAYLGSLHPAKRKQRSGDSATAAELADAESLYGDTCAACHGADARGSAEHFIPSIAGQNASYLLTQMRRLAHGHRFDTPEELIAIFDGLTSAQMEALAHWLARLPASPDRTAALAARRPL